MPPARTQSTPRAPLPRQFHRTLERARRRRDRAGRGFCAAKSAMALTLVGNVRPRWYRSPLVRLKKPGVESGHAATLTTTACVGPRRLAVRPGRAAARDGGFAACRDGRADWYARGHGRVRPLQPTGTGAAQTPRGRGRGPGAFLERLAADPLWILVENDRRPDARGVPRIRRGASRSHHVSSAGRRVPGPLHRRGTRRRGVAALRTTARRIHLDHAAGGRAAAVVSRRIWRGRENARGHQLRPRGRDVPARTRSAPADAGTARARRRRPARRGWTRTRNRRTCPGKRSGRCGSSWRGRRGCGGRSCSGKGRGSSPSDW